MKDGLCWRSRGPSLLRWPLLMQGRNSVVASFSEVWVLDAPPLRTRRSPSRLGGVVLVPTDTSGPPSDLGLQCWWTPTLESGPAAPARPVAGPGIGGMCDLALVPTERGFREDICIPCLIGEPPLDTPKVPLLPSPTLQSLKKQGRQKEYHD